MGKNETLCLKLKKNRTTQFSMKKLFSWKFFK